MNPMRQTITHTLFLLLILTGAAHAGGDAAAGKEKSAVCQACHGADGNGVDPQYPKLAGQYEDYLYHSLKAYKSGERANVIMAGFVANLTEEDMQDLAAYYAGLETQLTDLDRN
jgi:cytochrome c553